jgi:hypothetical protein
MVIGFAIEKNQEFAHKMLKTLVILANPQFRISPAVKYGITRIGKYLTYLNLPNK